MKLFSSSLSGLLLLCLFFSSCARAPLTDPKGAFVPSTDLPDLRDSYSEASLKEAIQKTLAAYKTSKIIPNEFVFNERVIARDDYRLALEALLPELENFSRFHTFVRQNFDLYQVYGDDEKVGQVFSTGYYDVIMPGSKKPKDKLTEPIYRQPPDLVSIDLNAYKERNPDLKPLQDLVTEQKSRNPSWKGRLVKDGPIPKIVPYYQRAQIQRERPLKGQGLEIVYVNPIDAFFLEVQGSGVVELPGGKKIHVGFAAGNGSPYGSIGKFLYDVIPKELMSMQRIRQHLETLNRDQQQDVFDKNPSFVFFNELKTESLTYSGAEVTAMRTIASDSFLFSKGTLGFLEIELPVFADAAAMEPASWEMKPRWVLDQDTGGAIKGGGRIDLYTGMDKYAERAAGVMKRKGRLWVVAPKAEFLERLKQEKK